MKTLLILPLAFLFGAVAPAAPTPPRTLLDFRKTKPPPATLHDSVLIIIDAQREYVDGKLPLDGMDAAVGEAARLLQRARAADTPVIHIIQSSPPGGALFDPAGPYAAIVPLLTPREHETVIAKTLPNAFAGTVLDQTLRQLGRKNLIVVGYMTHMCVGATVHAALDLSYNTTVVAAACATRDLPDGQGGTIPAGVTHRAHLAGLADRFAQVVETQDRIPD